MQTTLPSLNLCSTTINTTTCKTRGSTSGSRASRTTRVCCTACRRAGWPVTRSTRGTRWPSAVSTSSPPTWCTWWQPRTPKPWPVSRTTGRGCTTTRCYPTTWRSSGPRRPTTSRARSVAGGTKGLRGAAWCWVILADWFYGWSESRNSTSRTSVSWRAWPGTAWARLSWSRRKKLESLSVRWERLYGGGVSCVAMQNCVFILISIILWLKEKKSMLYFISFFLFFDIFYFITATARLKSQYVKFSPIWWF